MLQAENELRPCNVLKKYYERTNNPVPCISLSIFPCHLQTGLTFKSSDGKAEKMFSFKEF
jgi:hypothetical protein